MNVRKILCANCILTVMCSRQACWEPSPLAAIVELVVDHMWPLTHLTHAPIVVKGTTAHS